MKSRKYKKEMTIDDLAMTVQKGFLGVEEKINKVENKVDNLENKVDKLEKGQEEIKMQLNRRVHIFDHKDLEYRVEKLEEKAGITRRK